MSLMFDNTKVNEAYSKMNASQKIEPAKKQSSDYGKHPSRCIMEAYKGLGAETPSLEFFAGNESINEAKVGGFDDLKAAIIKGVSFTGKDKKDTEELEAMADMRKVNNFKEMKKILKDKYNFGKAEFKELEKVAVDAQFESVQDEAKHMAIMVNSLLTVEALDDTTRDFIESLNDKTADDITEADKTTIVKLFTLVNEADVDGLDADQFIAFIESKVDEVTADKADVTISKRGNKWVITRSYNDRVIGTEPSKKDAIEVAEMNGLKVTDIFESEDSNKDEVEDK